MKTYVKECEGQCPKCMSENIEYGESELDGKHIFYRFTCKKCGADGKEWYRLDYEESYVEDE